MATSSADLKQRILENLDVEPQESGLKQRILDSLGPKPEPGMAGLVNQGTLGAPGMEAPLTRLRINAADTFTEKLSAFRQTFPKGELTKDPVSGELLFRPDAATPFAKVDADLLEKFEPLGDFIDFVAEDLGAISGELAAAMRTRGISLIGLMARLFAGGTAGEVAQEGAESAAGFQFESGEEIAGRALLKGGVGAGGGAAGKGAEMAINFARGAGTVRLMPGAEKAMQAAERQGIPQLMPFQVSDSPILKKLAGQAGSVLPKLSRRIQEQNAKVTELVRNLQDRSSLAQLPKRLNELHDRVSRSVLTQAQDIARRTEASEAGTALSAGVAEYAETSRVLVNNAYAAARRAETPEFNYTPVYDAIDNLTTGTPFRTTTGETAQAGAALHPELRAVMDDLGKLDPAAPDIVLDGKRFTVTDALLQMRSRLWDLKTPNPGELARQEHRQAGELYRAVTQVLDNPVNANPQFVALWREARQSAARRFDNFEKLIVMQAAKTETPAQLAVRLSKPHQVDNLRMLKSIVPAEKYTEFQNFFKSSLLRDPDGITKGLAKYDSETLAEILTPDELGLFRRIGGQIDQINSVGIREALERQDKPAALVKDLILRPDTARNSELYRMMLNDGGKRGDVGQSIRAGIIDDIWGSVAQIPKGQGTAELVRSTLNSKIAELKNIGVLRFLDVSDLRRIRDLQAIKNFIDVGVDTGTSIQAAEAISGMRSMRLNAFHTLLEHIGVGRLMISDFGRRLLTGIGREKKPLTILKATSGALATAMSDVRGDVP